MKKIMIVPLVTGEVASTQKIHYPPVEDFVEDSNIKVHYALNAYMASSLEKGDEVKVIMLKTLGSNNLNNEDVDDYKKEFNEIASKAQAKVEYAPVINIQFDLSKEVFHEVFLNILRNLENDTDLYVDMTYGTKATPALLMSVMQFADKFYDCTVKKIIYGKVQFQGKQKEIVPGSEGMIDITLLYSLSSLTSNIEAPSAEKALSVLDSFFKL